MKTIMWFGCLALAVAAGGCAPPEQADASGRPIVFVSIPPQAYFVERIAGDRVAVEVLVPPGRSPATYEPTPQQMAALAKAKLYFKIGVPFEQGFLPKLQTSGSRSGSAAPVVIDMGRNVPRRKMKAHHEGKEHNHIGGTDPHIWLSPKLVKIQARNIADALIRIDPAGSAIYEANYAAFVEDLDALDRKLTAALEPVKGKTFLVFHPSWGYFADAYGLFQEPIEVEGKEPSAKQLARIVATAKAKKIRVIFVQPQFSRSSAEAIAEAIDGVVIRIDPLARDYIGNLEQVAVSVREALDEQER